MSGFFLCPSSSFFLHSAAICSRSTHYFSLRFFPITNQQKIPVVFVCLYSSQTFSPIPWGISHKWKKMGSLFIFRTRKGKLPSAVRIETRVAFHNTRRRTSAVVSRQGTRIKTDQPTNMSYLQLAISLSSSNLSKYGRIGRQTQYL